MPDTLPRRTFLALTALGAAAPLLPRTLRAAVTAAASAREPFKLGSFPLTAVRLRPGEALTALQINRGYLMGLDPERLLHMFRVTAGLPSSAAPFGGWEAPDNELRGHFTGHYLSACALLAAHTGDAAVRARGIAVAAELGRCQSAIGTGYLSAFPVDLFDRLRAGQRAWAPFYTLHKIMAGLLDTATLSGDPNSLDTLTRMAAWVERWTQPLDEEAMARVLEREYGGMNELLYNLAAQTHEARWSRLAHRFDRERVFAPLAAGRDELKGLHVNTTIPQIIGAARGYEVGGSAQLHDVAANFWQTVATQRCYCTGGTSNGETWNTAPGVLAHELSGYTEESCVTYNMQKLTRHLYAWTADARFGDYYERTFYNGILGMQHPADGDKLYYLPLAGGYWKLFGTPLEDFWCCTGSMAESFAKLGDSIYFRDAAGVYVNLFVPSELDWKERGVRLTLDTRFPEEDRLRLTVNTAKPARFALRVRVPYWTDAVTAELNGRALTSGVIEGGYLRVARRWSDGDVLAVRLPMRLHTAPMPDDPSVQAVMYGPLVLGARLGTAGLDAGNLRAPPTRPRTVPEYAAEPIPVAPLKVHSADPADWLAPLPGKPLEFTTTAAGEPLTLVPLNRIFDERYAVYFNVTVQA